MDEFSIDQFVPQPPAGIPSQIVFAGRYFQFDCIAGNGEAIYQHVDEKGNRRHVIVVQP